VLDCLPEAWQRPAKKESRSGRAPGAGGEKKRNFGGIVTTRSLWRVACDAVDEPGDGAAAMIRNVEISDGGDAAVEEHDGDHDQEDRDEASVVREREHEFGEGARTTRIRLLPFLR